MNVYVLLEDECEHGNWGTVVSVHATLDAAKAEVTLPVTWRDDGSHRWFGGEWVIEEHAVT